MMNKLQQMHSLGQSPWLNYMRRSFIISGELRGALAKGIRGITANADVFAATIAHAADYDADIRKHLRAGRPAREIHEALMVDDVQRAADLLHPVCEASDGLDGVASLELDPALAGDAVATVATARHLLARIDRGNAMVEVPATLAGTQAIRDLVADGINVNATHIFSTSAFERVAQAYIAGLEAYLDSHSVWRTMPTAVASVSVAPLDEAVNALLKEAGRPDLMGCTALAEARTLYGRFAEIFAGPRWAALAGRGAREMRPKWTRLTPADPLLPGTYYLNELIGPRTVMTFTPASLALFMEQGHVHTSLAPADGADTVHLATVAALDINVELVAAELLETYLRRSVAQYEALVNSVLQKVAVTA